MISPRTVRRIGALALSLVAAQAIAGLPNGSMAITDHQLDPHSKTFDKDLRKEARTSLKQSGGSWHIYFVAYLKKAAGAEEVNIVFYELDAGKREQVTFFPINTSPSAKILMSDVEISPEQGFKPGKKYDILITRLIGGKEEVYAHANLELL